MCQSRLNRPGRGTGPIVGIRKIGVEEELMLIDPETCRLTSVAEQAVRAHDREDGRRDPR